MSAAGMRRGPPPLAPFGLRLHHDGHWTHEGHPITNAKLRERFDRAVRYLPEEDKFVVQIRHFRGEIELEEAGFFVRDFDPEAGTVSLSDGTVEPLDVASLHPSRRDGALLCTVKKELKEGGLLARFQHAAQAELLHAVTDDGCGLQIGDARVPLPPLD